MNERVTAPNNILHTVDTSLIVKDEHVKLVEEWFILPVPLDLKGWCSAGWWGRVGSGGQQR